MDDSKVEACARAAHEANRAYCIALGDHSQAPWDIAPEWQRHSVREGVRGALAGNSPEQSHDGWCRLKVAEGWAWGAVKDPEAKTHPCLVPYDALPPEHKAKDRLFLTVVRSVAAALGLPIQYAGGGHSVGVAPKASSISTSGFPAVKPTGDGG
ncbi:MAG: hypothetical protein HOW73_43535 [Polyangiaceae bacterium]|nr:hypothetical protein [Polyangiaceae bacterium]